MALITALLFVQAVSAATVPFATLAQGSDSQIREPREVVARSEAEWQSLWAVHSTGPPPTVDFSRSLVVGLFLGVRRTAGYQVEIAAVNGDADHVVVEYVERRPAPDALVAQVLTAPFHLVTLPREVRTVEFRKRGD